MKTAFFTCPDPRIKSRTVHGSVTLKDDNTVSVSIADSKHHSPATRYQVKSLLTQIAQSGFNSPYLHSVKESNTKLIDILRKETESLRIQYIQKTKEYAKRYFEYAKKAILLPAEELYNQRGIKYEMKPSPHGFDKDTIYICPAPGQSKAIEKIRKEINRLKDIVDFGFEKFEAKEVKLAERHYEDSLIKLSSRIEAKGLNQSKLTVKTSHIGVNIDTTLTDGTLTVRAFTIIAEGEIQRAHYRYLIK